MENMRFKVGDRVLIKNIDWYNANKSKSHGTVECGGKYFDYDMREWCGKTMTILEVYQTCYIMQEDGAKDLWTDEMIEGLVEEEVGLVDNFSSRWVNEFNLPDGYIFKDENGNIINATKIVLEKKKKEYPKTFEECVHVLEGDSRMSLEQMNTFRRLIDSRNAYWKIAGEEMGLDKPWEPKDSFGYCTYAILRHTGHIRKSRPCADSALLEFPTEEMRAAFYENFKEEIEQCKELL